MANPSEDFEGMQYLRKSATMQAIDQTKTFDSKKWLWIPEPVKKGELAMEGFLAATIKSTTGDVCECETQDGKVST